MGSLPVDDGCYPDGAADHSLIVAIRSGLRVQAEPQRAPTMQAYMKSAMPYLGVTVPVVRRTTQALLRGRTDADVLAATAAALWRPAEYREERYAATALLGHAPVRARLDVLPLLREFIVTGAWWDHVDEVSHRVGDLLRAHRTPVDEALRRWSGAPDRWLRRSSVIAQLGHRSETDRDLLSSVILANAADPDFFVRKAIGWALRDYARTDPEWVRRFVVTHEAVLSPLSRREARKHLQ
jgi:3-methyladenine DNA glycosylase AlkD